MKRVAMLLGLTLLMGADECHPTNRRALAARKLGGDALCTWKTEGTENNEITCITGGRRFTCLVGENDQVNCALLADSTPEAK